ncbi:C2 family cysteine protease [Legionella feeleii]|uniref:Coiled-coil protein n=1 Tax=Legionella feeleii TaxID=453 RepID=A0A0W0U989_9GAMM|nr:C2 family cysteine protease [Legionella feeleii]KTD04373.1 coiled-coil protein [Legionella feeleii]SPX62831.1 coiled-coil protein [Legionella feeleii]
MPRTRVKKGGLHISATDKRVERVFPGVRGSLSQSISVDNGKGPVELKKGTRVIIQPLNLDVPNEEPRFKITCFSDNTASADKSLPESQRDIVRGETYTYTTTDSTSCFRFDEHYERSVESLFPDPGSPSLSEINQGQIPDCFLLASIQAILNQPNGAAFLRGMMVQNNDGTTTVRLFNPKTLEPVYKRITTAVIHDQSGALSGHKALWVHVLESAYATMQTRHDGEVDASISSVFNEGGFSATATKILTGINTRSEKVGKKVEQPWNIPQFIEADNLEFIKSTIKTGLNKAVYLLCNMDKVVDMYKDSPSSPALDALRTEFAMTIPDEEMTDSLTAYKEYKDYLLFYFDNKAECDKIFASKDTEPTKLLKLIDLIGSTHPDAQQFIKHCFNYIDVPVETNVVRGERDPFSGYYQVDQIQQFRAIEKALADGCLVTASTPSKFDEAVPGLRNRHAYTILKVVTREEIVVNAKGEQSARPVCYVQMRNPWGSTGRVYQQKEGGFEALESREAGIFEIELVDFNRYYSSIQISDSANKRFAYDEKMQKLYKEVELAVADLRVDAGASLSELQDFDIQHKLCVKKLIDLELTHLHAVDEKLSKALDDIFAEKYDSELEEMAVKGLIKDVPMDFYTGDPEKRDAHLYALLKLRWAMKQEPPDVALQEKLQAQVIDAANSYDFWKDLSAKKLKQEIIVNKYAKHCVDELDAFNALYERVDVKLKEITDFKQSDLVFFTSNFVLLQEQVLRITSMKAALKNLGYAISDEELSDMHNKLKKITDKLIACEAIKEVMDELQGSIEAVRQKAAFAHERGMLTEEECQSIEKATALVLANPQNTQALNQLASTLLESEQQPRKEIGEELTTIGMLAEKLVNLWSKLKIFFQQAATFLFFNNQQYETGPRPSDSLEEDPPEIGSGPH